MNGYAVFKVQTHSSIKRQTGEGNSPFTCKLTYRLNCNPILKKFLSRFEKWKGRNYLEDSNTHDIILSGRIFHNDNEHKDLCIDRVRNNAN